MPKGPHGQNRPADTVAAAVRVGRIATGDEIEEIRIPGQRGAAGGKARAEGLSEIERGEIASKAARARWGSEERASVMTHTARKDAAAGREAVRMYPNNSLREPVNEYENRFAEVVKSTFTK
jgi:hypothetical protein